MKRPMLAAAALGLLSLLGPQAARAQFYTPPATNPFQRPVVSPYLNLRLGGNPAINYYGLVRPQEQTAATLLQLQQQVATGQAVLANEVAATQPTTGHPTRSPAWMESATRVARMPKQTTLIHLVPGSAPALTGGTLTSRFSAVRAAPVLVVPR